MHAHGVGSVVVVDGAARPVGVFTTTTWSGSPPRRRTRRPVAEVMTPPFSLPGHAMAYEAALAMARGYPPRPGHRGTAPRGVVSERDLFSLQRLGLGEITTEIRLAAISTCSTARRRDPQARAPAGRRRRGAEQLTLFVSVLNDRLCQRILEIERKHHTWSGSAGAGSRSAARAASSRRSAPTRTTASSSSPHDGAAPDCARASCPSRAR